MTRSDNTSDSQKLSQLMDGEWLEINPADSVAKLCADPALRGKWERYHLIRDALNNEPVQVTHGMAERVSAALEHEPAYSNITPFSHAGQSDRQSQVQPVQAEQPPEAFIPVARPEQPSTLSDRGERITIGEQRAQTVDLDAANAQSAAFSSAAAAPTAPDTSVSGQPATEERRGVFRTGMTGLALAASAMFATVIGIDYLQGNAVSPSDPASRSVAVQALPNTLDTLSTADTSGAPGQLPDGDAGSATVVAGASSATSVGSLIRDVPDAFSQQVEGEPLLEVDYVSNSRGSYWMSPVSAERVLDPDRLNYLLSRHIEYSPVSAREGLLPFSRLVGYDEAQPGR